MASQSKTEQILTIARAAGIIRPRDLAALGIPRIYLRRLHRQGLLLQPGRGLYILPDADLTEHHSLAAAAKRAPRAVVCLLSALRFHGLTTQLPSQVWLALGPKARAPRSEAPRLRIIRMSGRSLTAGVEEHRVDSVAVKIFNPVKTVVDCFKYRNKIGLDVALEALRDARRQRRIRMDELWRYAEICRVTRVMRPYLESLG